MKKWIKKWMRKFILWYMAKEEFNAFSNDKYVVRVFTQNWYDEHIRNIGWGKVTDLNYAIDLLEKSAEEIENLYGKETTLTTDIRFFLEKRKVM